MGGGIFFFSYNIGSATKEILIARMQVATRDAQIKELAALSAEAVAVRPFEASLRGRLPSRDALFAFSKNMEQLARVRNVGFGFSFGSESVGSGDAPSYVSFTITSGGSTDKLLGYLEDIEKSSYIIGIASVDIRDNGMIINGVLYYKQ